MNKLFAKTAATTTDETKKDFAFDFSLNTEEDTKSNSKNKSKKKKKKNLVISDLTAEVDSDNVDIVGNYPKDSQSSVDNLSLPITEELKAAQVINNRKKVTEQKGNILKINDSITEHQKVALVKENGEKITENKGIILKIDDFSVDTNENIDIDKIKKKKKKKSGGKTPISEKDEDIDFLVNEINHLAVANTLILNASPKKSITKTSPAITATPNLKSQQKTLNSNLKDSASSSSKNSSNAASFSFKSHKDPELSLEQKSLFRFGNGKNLVAIGPPKHKAKDPWQLGPPPGLGLGQSDDDKNYDRNNGNDNCNDSDRKNDSNSRNESVVSHCSPFSFGFGL